MMKFKTSENYDAVRERERERERERVSFTRKQFKVQQPRTDEFIGVN